MRDYAELVKDLRHCSGKPYSEKCDDCQMDGIALCQDLIMRYAADAIEELLAENADLVGQVKRSQEEIRKLDKLLAAVPRWISVEDELPEESGYTIVYCDDGGRRHVTFAKYQKTPKRWELSGARSYWRVLRWMPLPEPPKEVE